MSQILNFINSSNLRLACEQNSVFSPVVYIIDPCTKLPTDLTGYTVKMQVRVTVDSEEVVLEISTEEDNVTITPLEGKIAINVPSEVTAEILAGMYVYDLNLIDADEESRRVLQGKFEVTASVTR